MSDLSIAKRVKELRNRKGISQELLAEKSGLSLRTIQRIEKNETVPRGDTLKRLSIVLKTSPDKIIDWKAQEDQNYLILMNLSAISILLFPLLGMIIPLIMWVSKRSKLKSVNELGKSILNFQITWTLLLFLYYIFIMAVMIFNPLLLILPMGRLDTISILIPILILYGYNLLIIIFNTIRIYNKKSFRYIPAIRLLR